MSYSNFLRSRYNKTFKSQYFSELMRYGSDVHVIMTFIDFKITFNNMGAYGTTSFVSDIVSN